MARTWLATGGRGSGRTTRAMLDAPKGSVYVWVNHHLDYPRELARRLGRDDLNIVSPRQVEDQGRWAGMRLTDVRLDHALLFTDAQREAYQWLLTRIRPAPESSHACEKK
jgi:hypothetical protein